MPSNASTTTSLDATKARSCSPDGQVCAADAPAAFMKRPCIVLASGDNSAGLLMRTTRTRAPRCFR